MGTQPIPESKPAAEQSVVDTPRVGPLMWVLLAGFLVPPVALTAVGNSLGGLPHQTLWIILLGLPFVIMVLSLPMSYTIDAQRLTIRGLFYRVRIPRQSITAVERVKLNVALVHPGSVFCSDPVRALKVERRGKMTVIISPRRPEPFLELDPARRQAGP